MGRPGGTAIDLASAAPEVSVASQSARGQRKRWGRAAILGKLPAGCYAVTARVAVLRQALIRAIEGAGRMLDVEAECHIQTALRHEAVSQLCLRELRLAWDKLTPEQRLAFLRSVGGESDLRDRSIRALDLSGGPSPIDALYSTHPAVDLGGQEETTP